MNAFIHSNTTKPLKTKKVFIERKQKTYNIYKDVTNERIVLHGKKRGSVVYVRKVNTGERGITYGNTKYVRTGGDWETLKKAMKVKKGGGGEGEDCMLARYITYSTNNISIPKNYCTGDVTVHFLKERQKEVKNIIKPLGRTYNAAWLQDYDWKSCSLFTGNPYITYQDAE